jgi:hypothetical protein
MKQSSRGSVAIALPSFLLAGIGLALALMMYVPFAYAEEVTTTSASSTVTVAPEKLEKELKKFTEKESNLRDTRAVAVKMKMIERRIAELKKHIERYEGLLKRLKAVEGTSSTTRPMKEKREEMKDSMKDKMKEKASSTRVMKAGVLGAATSAPVVPVIPVCRISFDKQVYAVGDVIKVSWKSTGAGFANFVEPENNTLKISGEKQDANSSYEIIASVSGNPEIMLKVTSVTGHTSLCGRVVPILPAGASVNDKRIAPLTAQLMQVQKQIEKLMASRVKIDENIVKLSTNLGIIQSKIAVALELGSGPVAPSSTPSKLSVSFDGFSDSTLTSGENDTIGEYTINFEVIASGGDVYVPKTTGYTAANRTVGVNYRIDGASSTVPARGVSAALSSDADQVGDKYVVREGSAEAFTLKIVYDPTSSGMYRVQLLQLNWSEVATGNPTQRRAFTPYPEFRTAFLNINQ